MTDSATMAVHLLKLTELGSPQRSRAASLLRDVSVQLRLGPSAPTWLERMSQDCLEGRALAYVALNEAQEVIGAVALTGLDHGNRRAQLSYWVGSQYRNRGVARAAARQALAFVFDRGDVDVVDSCVESDNEASIRVLQRLGFHEESPASRRRPGLLFFSKGNERGDARGTP